MRHALSLLLLIALFSKTAAAQYVQPSVNLVGLTGGIVKADVELPVDERSALELGLGYRWPVRTGGSPFRDWGWRGDAMLKFFGAGVRGEQRRGFYFAPYLRLSQRRRQRHSGGALAYRTPTHIYRKAVLGAALGTTLVTRRRLAFGLSGGLGVIAAYREVELIPPPPQPPSSDIFAGLGNWGGGTLDVWNERRGGLELYLRVSVGYRFVAGGHRE